jgi:hypothetical protein
MAPPPRTPSAVTTRYYHGGVSGLRVGDIIEPGHDRFVEGCHICETRKRGEVFTDDEGNPIDPPTGRHDRVHLTTNREYARFYASMAVYGDLYRVEPVGDVEPSTEDPNDFSAVCVPAARVIAVYDRCVRLTPSQRKRIAKLWKKADEANERGGVE